MAEACGLPLDGPPVAPRRRWPRAPRFGLDLIGLALVRIGTAGCLLMMLGWWLTVSRACEIAFGQPTWPLSVAIPFYLLAVAAHVSLLLGWRTRPSACASAVAQWATFGEPLLIALTLWCALLPSAARLSLDGIRRGPGGPPARVSPWLFAAHLLTLCWLLYSPWPLLPLAIALVPAAWWRRLPALVRLPGVTVWFDGECGICTRAARLLGQIHGGRLEIHTIQEDPVVLALSNAHDSFVVDTADGRRLLGWAAVRALLRASPWLWPLSVPLPGGERLYRFIADHRHHPWWGWLAGLPAEEPVPWWIQVPVVAGLIALAARLPPLAGMLAA